MASVGFEFKTGNSTVSQLPVGATLEVVGPGRLAIVNLPQKQVGAGARFQSKYGPATVVDFTSTGDFNEHVADVSNDDEVFYIADGTTRVRRTHVSNVK